MAGRGAALTPGFAAGGACALSKLFANRLPLPASLRSNQRSSHPWCRSRETSPAIYWLTFSLTGMLSFCLPPAAFGLFLGELLLFLLPHKDPKVKASRRSSGQSRRRPATIRGSGLRRGVRSRCAACPLPPSWPQCCKPPKDRAMDLLRGGPGVSARRGTSSTRRRRAFGYGLRTRGSPSLG
jgi:hypothetical protein